MEQANTNGAVHEATIPQETVASAMPKTLRRALEQAKIAKAAFITFLDENGGDGYDEEEVRLGSLSDDAILAALITPSRSLRDFKLKTTVLASEIQERLEDMGLTAEALWLAVYFAEALVAVSGEDAENPFSRVLRP